MFASALASVLALGSVLNFSAAIPTSPPKKICDTPMLANYSDLPGLTVASVPALYTVPSPFEGLNYGKGWGGGRTLSGLGVLVFQAITQVRGPTDIGLADGARSYAMKSFDWYGGIVTGQAFAFVPANTTLDLHGVTDAKTPVSHTCKYVAPLGSVAVPPITQGVPQRCTLPDSFARAVDVTFAVEGLGAAQFVALTDFSYELHKYC